MENYLNLRIAVVIPVYKQPDMYEQISLIRCCRCLSRYSNILICPQSFDAEVFHKIWDKNGSCIEVERFSDIYFDGILGYNRLLLSQDFYLRFADYDYILVYQPDAYVFEDKLTEWCMTGYDYIGAPLVGEYGENEYHSNMQLRVGNGGFSLRRVKAFLSFFDGNSHVFNSHQIIENISFWKKPYTRWLVWLLMMFGWHNTPQWLSSNYKWNEDCFWSMFLSNSQYALNVPDPEEALMFAFERFPKEMYAKINKLPFGCHAWRKYEYEEFWKCYIS